MTIIRSPRVQRDFTIISNSVCLDPRLSMRALGLLVRLLCRPDNWRTNSETLAREFDCGREQMRGVLRELAAAGYMRLIKARDDRGQWATHWAVFDTPQDAQPADEEPAPGKPYVGALGPITRTDETRTENKTPIVPTGKEKKTKTNSHKTRADTTLQDWISALPADELAIREDDPLYQDGIPVEMLTLAWAVFKERHADGRKKYADWRAAFRDCVRRDYLKLWAIDREGTYYLTTVGKQAAQRLGVK